MSGRPPRPDPAFDAWLRQHEPELPAADERLKERILQRVAAEVPRAAPHGSATAPSRPGAWRRLTVPASFWLAAAASLLLWWRWSPRPSAAPGSGAAPRVEVAALLLDDLAMRVAGERLQALEQTLAARQAETPAIAPEVDGDLVEPADPVLGRVRQQVAEAGLGESPEGLARLASLRVADADVLGRPTLARWARELARQHPDSFTAREALRLAEDLER